MSKCLFPPSFLNPTNYERCYIFIRVNNDPLEQAYIESLEKRVKDTPSDGIHLAHCNVFNKKSNKCNCKQENNKPYESNSASYSNSTTLVSQLLPSTSAAPESKIKADTGKSEETVKMKKKLPTEGEDGSQWKKHSEPRFFWIGPQAHILVSEGPQAYFYPIANCYALSIAFYAPGLEFAILVDRRPAHCQQRKLPFLPGYRRLGLLIFDGLHYYLQGLCWDSQRHRIELPEGIAPLMQEKRDAFLRRYWSDTI